MGKGGGGILAVTVTIIGLYGRYFQNAHFIPMVGVGKERRILIGPWGPAKAAPATGTTLRFTGPVPADSSAVNAIGTQLRGPINSGLVRWRMAV